MQEKPPRKMRPLIDIAAAVVAKHCSCEQLESSTTPLDEPMLKKVGMIIFPKTSEPCGLQVK